MFKEGKKVYINNIFVSGNEKTGEIVIRRELKLFPGDVFNRSKLIWLSMIISGGLAGLAGIAEVSGTIGQLLPSVSPGYGFTAIIVAFLGRLNPIGVLFAGLILALTYIGGENAQIEIGLPAAVTGLFQGIILFYLLACDVLARYRLRYKPFLKASSRE